MILSRVIGNVVSTVKHPTHEGRTVLVCQPVDLDLIRAGASNDGATRQPGEVDLLGWDRYARGKIHVHTVAGNHFTVLDSEHVGELAGILERTFAGEAGKPPA